MTMDVSQTAAQTPFAHLLPQYFNISENILPLENQFFCAVLWIGKFSRDFFEIILSINIHQIGWLLPTTAVFWRVVQIQGTENANAQLKAEFISRLWKIPNMVLAARG